MNVLAFDQSLSATGWTVGSPDRGLFACGRILSPVRRFDSLGARFLRFEKGVRELLTTYKPALVVFEEHRAHHGVQAAQVLGAVTGILMARCDELNITYTAVPVATLKKFGSGAHNASKALMVATAKKKYPALDIVDDNVADAAHMAAWGLTQL